MRTESENGRKWVWAAALFVLALAPRIVHLLTIRDSPFFSLLYIDPLMYDEWGLRIAGGQLLGDRPFFLDPLYPYFLGAVFAIFGHHFEAVAAVQSLLGALVAPLVHLAARRWLDLPAARTAGVIAALYLPSIYFGGLIMKPGLATFLVAVGLWQLSRGLAEPAGRLRWAATGVVWGLACLVRGNLVLVVPPLAAWVLLRGPGPAAARALDRHRWREAGPLLAGTLLVLALPAGHNWLVGGEFILTTANAGANFFIGNNPSNATGEYQQLPFIDANPLYEQRDFASEAVRRSGRAAMSDREVSAFWFAESREWIRRNPGDWLRLVWRKTRSFWGAYEIPDSLDYYLYREYAPVLRLPVPGYGLLAPLALLGAALALRRRGWPRLLLVFIAVYSASVVLFFVFSRFRMVIAPALFALAGFGAVELVRRWRSAIVERRGLYRTLGATGLLLALLVFVNVPVRARTDTWSYRVARAVGLPTRAETSSLGHYNLGVAYARPAKQESERRAPLRLAEVELRTALRLQGRSTEHARIQVELGKVLARQGRNAEAIATYREASGIEPRDYAIHHALGILYERQGDAAQAVAALSTALSLAPRHVASATLLGRNLLQLGRNDEAARAFRHALTLAPNDREALDGLRRATGAP
jgi:Flp pilus assembly protein TadD